MKTLHWSCPLICLLGLAACDTEKSPPPLEQSAPQALSINTPMMLGEGYDLVTGDPTGVECVSGPRSTKQYPGIDGLPIFSFYVDRPQEIRSKAIDIFATESLYSVFEPGGTFNIGQYNNGPNRDGLDQFVTSFFEGENALQPTQSKNDQLLIIAVELSTVLNEANAAGCGSGVNTGDYEAALSQCGDTYLDSESYGGIMFLALPRPELQDPQIMAKVDELLKVNTVAHDLDAELTLNALRDLLNNAGLGNLEFSILLPEAWWGMPQIQTIRNQHGTPPKVKPQEGREILQFLSTFTLNVITNRGGYIPNPQSQGLGHKMRRRLSSYNGLERDANFRDASGEPHWFASCGIPKPQNYQCYLDFADDLNYLQRTNQKGSFHRTAAYVREALTRPSEFAWPLDTNNDPDYTAFGGFLSAYDKCVGPPSAFEGALGDCRARLVSEPQALCQVCNMANFPDIQKCTAEFLDQEANALPQIFERAAFTPTVSYPVPAATQGAPKQMQSSDDYICTLSQLGGDMKNTDGNYYATSNPAAGLAIDNSNPPRFVLQKTAYYPNYISVGGNCIAKSNFYGTNFPGSEPWISQLPAFVSEVLNIGSVSDPITNDPAAAGALLGVTGNFYGSGETAWATLNDPNTNSAELYSAVYQAGSYGPFKSHITPFGLLTSFQGVAQHYKLNNNDYQVHISSFDKGGTSYKNVGEAAFAYKDYRLAPTAEAYCHLTKISGTFAGGGERVILGTRGDDWILTVHGAWGKPVRTEARCYLYNQADQADQAP